MKVAFLGLGVMGYPMAGYLTKNGHDVTVYNRTTAKAEKWAAEYNGNFAETPAKATEGAQIVFACVGNDDDLRSVCTGDNGAFSAMDSGAIFIDHTTTSAEVARELYAKAKEIGLSFMDAPVSGGQAGAENGTLTIMVGGDEADFATTEPVQQSYAQAVTHMGDVGAGQLTKMVNQITFVAAVQGISEGLAFAENAGLDAKKVIDVISKGAAGSWQLSNRGYTMVDDKFDFGFAVDWVRKDLGFALDESRKNGSALPVTGLIDQYYKEVQRMGGGRWDTSSLIKLLRD
ncbi:NAD(P)-dependent oxidoreductase [Terasakiella sp. A23]|uniref:NAD(P)-dependent oxidoreductase n=1 Tax=Terasakiella sp. FCG-A23 TaxID=3080561 RepID=UPI0029550573|nr:NAD(P)-dependent oxidoreductase [Terasakiella sp. A23]MDV7338593.1 NAD(P)-dependent oxidoreductase [Terasakiella sp. A23]